MAITTVIDLKATLTDYDTCNALFFIDSTGAYSLINNLLGYGVSSGVATTDITGSVLTINFNSLNTSAVFTFTVSSGTITAATLSFAGAGPDDILASLVSTDFPFDSTNPFPIYWDDYGVTLPTLDDQIISCSYVITGTHDGTGFSYTALDALVIKCQTKACISKKFIDAGIDTECVDKAYTADKYLKQAEFACDADLTDEAVVALNNAISTCNDNCDCGC